MKLDFSAEGWGRVVASTVLGSAACVVITVWVDSFNFPGMTMPELVRALLVDTLLPIGLAVPLILFFAGKLRDLAIAHRQLTVYASTDSLTQVMNRGAFSTLVDAYLTDIREHDKRTRGALLIIDADNFKAVNDHFGHDRGDEALITIAQTIKSTLRSPDLVGRLGGEEFAVFLPGADKKQAIMVGERIRRTVNEANFTPDGTQHPLSVSVGGAVFQDPMPYQDLFRLADRQLYAAKQAGRNRVEIAPVAADALVAA